MANQRLESLLHSGEMSLVMRSETLMVHGSWKYNDPESESWADLKGLAIDFDFMVNVENQKSIIHPKDIAYVKRICNRLRQGKTVDYNFRVISSDGMVKPLQGHGALIHANKKADKSDLATLDEIASDRELQYKILRFGEQVALLGSWTWNLETDELFFSEGFQRHYGIEPYSTDSSWESFVLFVHPDDKTRSGTVFRISLPKASAHLPNEKIYKSAESHRLPGGEEAFVLDGLGEEARVASSVDGKHRGYFQKNALARALSSQKPTVLVIHDNAAMRDNFNGFLQSNYYVIAVENGKKATMLMQRGLHPDLVLADVVTPEIDCFELLHWIKENAETRLVPVILLSAYEGEEARVACIRHGADDYIVKPFSTRELIARIEARIEASNVRKFTERHLREANRQLDHQIREKIVELKQSKHHLRQLTQTRTESNQKLKLMNNELAAFALVTSQNLREPLSIIHESCHTLLEKEVFKPLEIGKDIFFSFLSSTLHMKVIVDGIYTFSRISFGEKEITLCDLNELLEQVKNDLQDIIQGKMIVVKHTKLPVIKGNAPQFTQLFYSMIGNAIKFRLHGRALRINIGHCVVSGKKIKHPAASPYRKYLRLDFADNGAGFDAEPGRKILQMFELSEMPIDCQNMDIALVICKKVVENHDGFITIKSSPGKGSVLSCYMAIVK